MMARLSSTFTAALRVWVCDYDGDDGDCDDYHPTIIFSTPLLTCDAISVPVIARLLRETSHK
jgi:hypothetical protein